jgi:hypothetical protein
LVKSASPRLLFFIPIMGMLIPNLGIFNPDRRIPGKRRKKGPDTFNRNGIRPHSLVETDLPARQGSDRRDCTDQKENHKDTQSCHRSV